MNCCEIDNIIIKVNHRRFETVKWSFSYSALCCYLLPSFWAQCFLLSQKILGILENVKTSVHSEWWNSSECQWRAFIYTSHLGLKNSAKHSSISNFGFWARTFPSKQTLNWSKVNELSLLCSLCNGKLII